MKYQTGIALHQWPRENLYRKQLKAPDGYLLVEHDFSGQEMRWMAEYSRDYTMLNIFSSAPPNDDAHGYMGAALAHRDFYELLKCLQLPEEDPVFNQAKNDRYLGKFANLSLQYRTGAKKLRSKARIEYNLPMTMLEAKEVKATYERTFPGVPRYWETQIAKAKTQGFVETFSGKRYRFPADAWTKERTWSSESTSINWPIQAVGGSQKSLAMKYLKPFWQRTGGMFAWDLHDGLFQFYPEAIVETCALEAQQILNNLPYEKEWGFRPTIPFPVDVKIGPTWGELKEL